MRGKAGNLRLGRVGRQIDLADGDQVGAAVALAELEGRVAGDLVVIVGDGGDSGLVVEEAQRRCRREADQAEGGRELHHGRVERQKKKRPALGVPCE